MDLALGLEAGGEIVDEEHAVRRAAEGKEGKHVGEVSSEEEESEIELELEIVKNPENWDMEVAARFIRGVQELDLLGFVKHTGRKADHVHKTVYEPPEN